MSISIRTLFIIFDQGIGVIYMYICYHSKVQLCSSCTAIYQGYIYSTTESGEVTAGICNMLEVVHTQHRYKNNADLLAKQNARCISP